MPKLEKVMTVALIIEDNDNNLELICFILQKAHYKTRFARTGLDGISRALAIPSDFIMLDIQLPDISGIESIKTYPHASEWAPNSHYCHDFICNIGRS